MKTFKIYPVFPISKKYFLVLIFPTQKQMIAYAERVMKEKGVERVFDPELEACCIAYNPTPKMRKAGMLLFSQGNMPASTIAHELDHCVTRWIELHEHPSCRRTYSNERANEYRASLTDRLTLQFYEGLEADEG